MKATSSGVTRSGNPSAFCRRSADPRSACARRAAGVKTVSKLSVIAEPLSARSRRNPLQTYARLRETLLRFDHLAAFFADLVLVVFKAGQEHPRVLALALAELHTIRPARGALLRRALRQRNSGNNRQRNNNTNTQRHQPSFFLWRVRKHLPIVSPTWL